MVEGGMADPVFLHKIDEAREQVRRQERWTATIDGYDVIVVRDPHGTRLSIYKDRRNGVRLGIIECRPESVQDIETFAFEAERLFRAIASGLRNQGLDDLRSECDIAEERLTKGIQHQRT